MALNITTSTAVRILVTVDDGTRIFTDAMFFPPGQVPTNPELRSLAQDRYLAWLAIATAPPRALTFPEKVDLYRDRMRERVRLQAQIDGEDPTVVAAAG